MSARNVASDHKFLSTVQPIFSPRAAAFASLVPAVLLITFLYFTGCRIGAAQSITWSQVEFEDGRVLPRLEGKQTKNEEPILLPLPVELGEVLNNLPREGRVFDARNLRKAFQAACVRVGLGVKTGPKVWQYKGLLIHDFRQRSQKSHPIGRS